MKTKPPRFWKIGGGYRFAHSGKGLTRNASRAYAFVR